MFAIMAGVISCVSVGSLVEKILVLVILRFRLKAVHPLPVSKRTTTKRRDAEVAHFSAAIICGSRVLRRGRQRLNENRDYRGRRNGIRVLGDVFTFPCGDLLF